MDEGPTMHPSQKSSITIVVGTKSSREHDIVRRSTPAGSKSGPTPVSLVSPTPQDGATRTTWRTSRSAEFLTDLEARRRSRKGGSQAYA